MQDRGHKGKQPNSIEEDDFQILPSPSDKKKTHTIDHEEDFIWDETSDKDISTNIAVNEDEGDFTIVNRSPHKEEENDSVQITDTNFQVGRRLAPREVYRAAIGLFENDNFDLVTVLHHENFIVDDQNEIARVYRNRNTNKLHILYYPGKDNDNPIQPGDMVQPLKTIIDYFVDPELHRLAHTGHPFTREDLEAADKHFTVCESNTYMGVTVAHYIGAHVSNGRLTTDDSIDRDYDISYIRSAIPHTSLAVNKRGYQNMLFNHWACGFYTNESLRRILEDEDAPDDLTISTAIATQHFNLYKSGRAAVNAAEVRRLEAHSNRSTQDASDPGKDIIEDDSVSILPIEPIRRDVSEISELPVGGYMGSQAENGCTLPLSDFEKGLSVNARDQQLRLMVAQETRDAIIVRAYTKNAIPILDGAGLRRQEINPGRYCYDLVVSKDVRPRPGQPLFSIALDVTDEHDDEVSKLKMLDVSHLYDATTLETMRNSQLQHVRNPDADNPEHDVSDSNIADNNIFKNIRAINQYLKKRAQETSGFLSFLSNSYTGEDYYARRRSWKKILGKFNQLAEGELSAVALKTFIRNEAQKFKAQYFGRNDFYNCLMALHDAIPADLVLEPAGELRNRISNYYHIYNDMDAYRSAAKSYIQQHSWFKSNNKSLMSSIKRENRLYTAHYALLDDVDRHDFLTTAEEHESEYQNSNHYRQ